MSDQVATKLISEGRMLRQIDQIIILQHSHHSMAEEPKLGNPQSYRPILFLLLLLALLSTTASSRKLQWRGISSITSSEEDRDICTKQNGTIVHYDLWNGNPPGIIPSNGQEISNGMAVCSIPNEEGSNVYLVQLSTMTNEVRRGTCKRVKHSLPFHYLITDSISPHLNLPHRTEAHTCCAGFPIKNDSK